MEFFMGFKKVIDIRRLHVLGMSRIEIMENKT